MANEHALIYPHIADNSAATKAVTYKGEVVDFVQFAFMTTFSEGIDSISRYGFNKRDFVPEKSMIGLDIFAYAMMVYLAYIRSEKFKERYKAFLDHNSDDYYKQTANALIAAMSEAEITALGLNGVSDKTARVISLIKHDAHALSPGNIPAARTLIETAQIIFARAKKTTAYAKSRYDLLSWVNAINAVEVTAEWGVARLVEEKDFKKKSFEEIELLFAQRILGVSRLDAIVKPNELTPESFIADLHHLELTGSVDSKQKHLDLLEHYKVEERFRNDCYNLIKAFYAHYHTYQDKNDSAFYVGNMRGITGDEQCRTKFKENLYTTVYGASIIATLYSATNFVRAFFMPVSMFNVFVPLFLVGATSLVDEVADLHFKTRKYNQSKRDLEQWVSANKALSDMFINNKATTSYTPDPKELNLFACRFKERPDNINELFIKAKRQEYDSLVARIHRRKKKLIQASLSFTGVFFGVSLSMAVGILTLTTNTARVVDMLGFAGIGTIFVAFAAGAYMVHYQYQQHQNKGISTGAKQTDLVGQLELKHRADSEHPLRFSTYRVDPASCEKQKLLPLPCAPL